MNLLNFFSDILLNLLIVILLPWAVYWGVNTLHKYPKYSDYVTNSSSKKDINSQSEDVNTHYTTDQDIDSQIDAYNQAKLPYDRAAFIAYLIVGLLAISIGSFISIRNLSLGLIGGGAINIILALIQLILHLPKNPLLNFAVLLLLLAFIILVIIQRNRD